MKPLSFFLFLFIALNSFGNNKDIQQAESFFILGKLDSAEIRMNQLPKAARNAYSEILQKAINKEKLNYSDYNTLFSNLNSRQELNHLAIYDLYKQLISAPSDKEKFNYEYAKLCWKQFSRLRDEVEIDKSNSVHQELLDYINKYNQDLRDVQRAKILASTQEIVISLIETDIEKGISKCEEIYQLSEKIKDTNLIILSLFHKCDFLIEQGKLDEFINTSEKALELDLQQTKKSSFYLSNIMHLVDALIYKGGNEKRSLKLLDIIYKDESTKISSYSYYAKFLWRNAPNSEYANEVFNKFNVKTIIEFTEKIKNESKQVLNSNDYFHLLYESSKALANYNEDKAAWDFINYSIGVTREIYAKDLSESLSNYKSNLVKKEKEIEIKSQKEKKELYIIISILAIGLFILFGIAFFRKRKQSRLLKLKNQEIEKQKELLEKSNLEKSLLLKEIHHRVKNNFQIISSLLEVQFKEDETEQTKHMIVESRSRVKSMALIHQKLYQNDDLYVKLEDYISKLVADIQNTFGLNDEVITEIDIDPNYSLDIDTAIPLALIMNELITNAFKYGLDTKGNKLHITLSEEKDYKVITLHDNGPGLPHNIDLSKSKTLGLKLVRRLSQQLQGKSIYEYQEGAKFSVFYKESNLRAETD